MTSMQPREQQTQPGIWGGEHQEDVLKKKK